MYSHAGEYRKVFLANYLCIGFVPGGNVAVVEMSSSLLHMDPPPLEDMRASQEKSLQMHAELLATKATTAFSAPPLIFVASSIATTGALCGGRNCQIRNQENRGPIFRER